MDGASGGVGARAQAAMRYLIVMHKTRAGYCAGAPDVPGCVATGATREETESRFREALALHLEGEPLPEPRAQAVEVDGYNVVIEETDNGYRAEPQDIEDVVAAADTPERAEALIRETIAWRLENLRLRGEPPPKRISEILYVDADVAVPA